ncbi:acetylcholinesterase-like [Amblyomma americanum]
MISPVFLALAFKALFCSAYDVQRTTNLGPLRGRKIEILGSTIEEYRGIPYAQPPVGKLRFKPPVPAKEWKGTLDATSRRSGCPQPLEGLPFTGDVKYGEDCLHLNVWTRKGNRNAPVLVWIYGGGFTYGSASYDNYTGVVIAAKTGFVVASMNYRVGVLGFLNAGSPEAPGNMGLLDQYLALKWIKNNIAHFGGDPSRVALFGESAGAISVHAHMLSPVSKGLFQRAIAMSGVVSAPDVTESAAESTAKGDAMAAILGCRSSNRTLASHPDEVLSCLRKRSADELLLAAFQAVPGKLFPFLPTHHDAFLPEVPSVAVRDGSFEVGVDLLTGVTSDEALTLFIMKEPQPELFAEHLDNVEIEKLKRALHEGISSWLKDVPSSLLENDANETTSKASIRRKFFDYLGNRVFVCPMHSAAAAHASRGGSVYTYVFGHWPAKRAPLSWAGVGHGMDLPYTFGLPLLDRDHINFADKDIAASENLLKVIATFVEKGVPEYPGLPTWPKYSASSPTSILLKHDSATKIDGFRSEQCAVLSRRQ